MSRRSRFLNLERKKYLSSDVDLFWRTLSDLGATGGSNDDRLLITAGREDGPGKRAKGGFAQERGA